MRMHWTMWIIMALFFIGYGILNRGREDILEHVEYNSGYQQGAWIFLKDKTPRELSEIPI